MSVNVKVEEKRVSEPESFETRISRPDAMAHYPFTDKVSDKKLTNMPFLSVWWPAVESRLVAV